MREIGLVGVSGRLLEGDFGYIKLWSYNNNNNNEKQQLSFESEF